jgi:hypothetical protein
MRDDASRARLEEMGFDLYVPRSARKAAADVRAVAAPQAADALASGSSRRQRVALIARADSAKAHALLAQIARALAFARIDAAITPDAASIGDAAGLVVFGAALAREVGATVSADRQKTLEWVGAADLADIGRSVAARRALWSELRRLARALAQR